MLYSTVRVPSTFPIESRPIYLYPTVEVTHKTKEQAWPILARGIEEICNRNPVNRILVHTVSYDLTNYLWQELRHSEHGDRIIHYTNSRERQSSLDLYLGTAASVLLAPSLERGIDLAGDDCRAIVVCKVPFPNLGDKQVSARIHSPGGQLWYNVQTVRSIVQMTGRGMRGVDDYCESYILDKLFVSNLWRKSKSLIPSWWADALVWDAGRLF